MNTIDLLIIKDRVDRVKNYKHSNKYYNDIATIIGGRFINLATLSENQILELIQYLDNIEHKRRKSKIKIPSYN